MIPFHHTRSSFGGLVRAFGIVKLQRALDVGLSSLDVSDVLDLCRADHALRAAGVKLEASNNRHQTSLRWTASQDCNNTLRIDLKSVRQGHEISRKCVCQCLSLPLLQRICRMVSMFCRKGSATWTCLGLSSRTRIQTQSACFFFCAKPVLSRS